jgi:hypothetical protein
MIRLFINWYDSQRNDEIKACLDKNLSNPLIDHVHLMCDGTETTVPNHSKIVVHHINHRPTYNDYFREMDSYPDDIRIIANADIYFDQTLSLALSMPDNDCYALTRYDVTPEGPVLVKNPESQDVWIFKGHLKPINGDFFPGTWACDGRIAWEIRHAGYHITNPCKSIIIYHLHQGWKDIGSTLTVDDIVPPPYLPLWHRGIGGNDFCLGIGIPLTFPFVPSSFFHTYAQMQKPEHIYIHADNGDIASLRNNIVERALLEGVTNLIMMDTDQIYPVDLIPRLLAHNLPVVGARVHRRYPPFDSLMLRAVPVDENTAMYESVDDWDEDSGLIEVDATGGGCLMFDMDIFRNMPSPWFKTKVQPEGGVIGEDIGFCQDLKNAGYRIFVDPTIECGHLTTMIVNSKTNRLYRSMKQKEHKRNMDMALKTDNTGD